MGARAWPQKMALSCHRACPEQREGPSEESLPQQPYARKSSSFASLRMTTSGGLLCVTKPMVERRELRPGGGLRAPRWGRL